MNTSTSTLEGGGRGGRGDCLEVTWVAMSFVFQLTIQLKLIQRVPWASQFNWSLDIVSGKGLSSPFCYCIATICYVMPAFRKSIFSQTTCESSERNWYDIRPEKWAWTTFKVSWDKQKTTKILLCSCMRPHLRLHRQQLFGVLWDHVLINRDHSKSIGRIPSWTLNV